MLKIHKSSAGSGKTFILVKEYLRLALKEPQSRFKHILAITFTVKATAEMKNRIVKSTNAFATLPFKKLKNDQQTLANILTQNNDEGLGIDYAELQKRSKLLLSAILHNYSDFAVSTIDSFVVKLVKTFAYDLDLPVSFDMALNKTEILEQIVDLLISKVGEQEAELTEILVDYAKNNTEDEKSWNIDYFIKDFVNSVFAKGNPPEIEALQHNNYNDFKESRKTLKKLTSNLDNAVVELAEQGQNLIDNTGLEAGSFFQGSRGVFGYFNKIITADSPIMATGLNSYHNASFNDDKWYSGKADVAAKASIDGIKAQLIEVQQKIAATVDGKMSMYNLANQILKHLNPLALLKKFQELLKQYKVANNVLLLSEFYELISEVVQKQDAPFIYERIGEWYDHYLIDEFQDTSLNQWHNLLPLLENRMSEDGAQHDSLIVGDGKQSIYRWRGGEVMQFATLPKIYNPKGDLLVAQREHTFLQKGNTDTFPKEGEQNSNYRSCENIINFNNNLFDFLADKNPLTQMIYQNQAQLNGTGKQGGYVAIDFFERSEDNTALRLEKLGDLLKDLTKRGYSYGDIVILSRASKDIAKMANYLMKNGKTVVTPNSLLVSNDSKVQLVISCFKCIANGNDQIAKGEIIYLLGILKNLKLSAKHEQIFEATHNSNAEFSKLLNQLFAVDFSFERCKMLSVYETLDYIIDAFKLNNQRNAYLTYFEEAVFNYSNKKNQNLSEFLEWWEDNREEIAITYPESDDAIRLMTIHKSKGLEFPVVIMPFAEMNARVSGHLWFTPNKELNIPLKTTMIKYNSKLLDTELEGKYTYEEDQTTLDNLNGMYVAYTRAANELHLMLEQPRKISEAHTATNYLAQYCESVNGNYEGLTEFGSKTIKLAKETHDDIKPFFELSPIDETSNKIELNIKTSYDNRWKGHKRDKVDKGILVHEILAQVKTADKVDDVLEQWHARGDIDRLEKEQLSVSIKQLLSDPTLADWYKNDLTIINERTFIASNGEKFQPDRVAIDKITNNVAVIDYKTGKEAEKHKKQIKNYENLLKELGYKNVKSLLIYTAEQKIVEV